MRLDQPRVEPLDAAQQSGEVQEIMASLRGNLRSFNIMRTLANHPDLMRRWMVFANHILGKSTLPVRERELLILRIGYLCQSGYEWGQHVLIARDAGMTDGEIRACQTGSATPGLPDLDRLLFQATEELHEDAHVSDATWAGLSQHLNTQQLMDVVFTVGQYNLVSMALNSLGVQPDEGLPGWEI